ncbi:MAG: UDP-N-acetylmuramoyl-tripeptide--D-alanyl-D-alanine ligase [Spirochaetia bacterium]|nr:UDP-N-acetylmuramoyl-tripeptide--D-alanyl-D-alanine ligase [Spirochaetia bacterium]
MQRSKNELALSVDEIVKATGGQLLSSGEGTYFTGACTDSRMAGPGSIFFALKGEQTDGHLFVSSAADKGAGMCVVERLTPDINKTIESGKCYILQVQDALAALQALARFYRDKFPAIKMVGITGSSGKTTTKELIASILSKLGSTVCSKGNLNSEIGLPLSMFSIRAEHKFGVFEMGINHKGEMDALVGVLHPQVGVVTNIGTAHIGILGSQDNIAFEKGKIFSENPSLEAGFVNENDDYADYLQHQVGEELQYFTYGASMAEGFELKGTEGSEFTLGEEKIHFPLMGKYNFQNAMAAAAVGRYFGATDTQIKEALEGASTMFGRGELYKVGGIDILCDCYNANLEAVMAVVDFASEAASSVKRVVFVLGSLLEQGDESDSIHAKIGRKLSYSDASGIFLFGNEMKAAYDALIDAGKSPFWSPEYEALEKAVVDFVSPGDLVVVKGSRGMAMERIVEKLKSRGK